MWRAAFAPVSSRHSLSSEAQDHERDVHWQISCILRLPELSLMLKMTAKVQASQFLVALTDPNSRVSYSVKLACATTSQNPGM